MANIQSAKKRILQNKTRSEINKKRRAMLRGKIKKLQVSVDEKKLDESKRIFLELEPALAKAVNNKLFKKNLVSRTISRMSKKIKSIN